MRNDVGAILRSIGRRVAELREAVGLTQDELAVRLDVSRAYVQQVEGGKKNLSVRSLVAFADAVEVEMRELLRDPLAPPRKPGRPKKSGGRA